MYGMHVLQGLLWYLARMMQQERW